VPAAAAPTAKPGKTAAAPKSVPAAPAPAAVPPAKPGKSTPLRISPSPLLRLSAAAPAAITEKPVRVSSVSKASAAAQEPPSPKAPKVKRVKP
ncbi:MAG: hypothetical protein WAW03_16320, partial [Anaerolineae bacterium]